MASGRDFVERAPLPPPGAPKIEEGDRSRVFGAIGEQIDDIVNGPGSYYPEGHKKSPDALLEDLTNFFGSVERLSKQLDDPSNIMGDVLDQIKKFNDAFAPSARWSTPSSQKDKAIELPFKLVPETRDRNVIDVPDDGPYTPPMPWRAPRKDRNVLLGGPQRVAGGVDPRVSRRLATRLIYPS
ncbi:hypothetical protein [Bradyrhizobium sp. SZCCHNR1047]|uniref:hypothetical protein n=1 Tax=Bradyrhizobium sp. SZCCHNR1047 TaxID=3057354 RepID=UPI002916728E|nr:hypothetical protein [Bradyrhizobium sp. SZCCHNR1047]